ncbi:MAG: hypothetical protein NVSMB9_20600 [Isosphaeraceae bacterium]
MPTRWVGIDEAGYGPNFGPLVMTAVMAESPDDRPPDVWADLAAKVCRAGGDGERLWIDDSKVLYQSGLGRDRLEAACLAVTLAANGSACLDTFGSLLTAVGAGTLDEVELSLWLDAGDPTIPCEAASTRVRGLHALRPFEGANWRIIKVLSRVVGPARFNDGLNRHGSKAKVHFESFAELLEPLWLGTNDGTVTHVRGDKHGGRHYYYGPLVDILPDSWIDRGVEGPNLSCYTVRAPGRRLELSLQPRADSCDGLVALASVVSKAVRELWMDAFNAHWLARIPGLRPTAGYPGDSARFRKAIEPHCAQRGIAPDPWWCSR